MNYDKMICEECEIQHPVEIQERRVQYCPFCGDELKGYVSFGKIGMDESETTGDDV